MDEVRQDRREATPAESAPAAPETAETGPTRRSFLHGSARKLAYAAPLILLFHPKPACASGGSELTTA